ncbi:MAG: glycosyltransferase [Candidatus Hydrogenedens sp.]|nr:glycosyltransferase [Candidatus Hydrogenedens sp.]
MHIAMFSNTYLPFVGGLTISVASYAESIRKRGHRVLVVAPEFDGQAEDETDVLRVPAIKHFANSRFSIPLVLPGEFHDALDDFAPDLIHAHHPYLLGDTALREATTRAVPLVVTHHTHALLYASNLPEKLKWLAMFLDDLGIGYCNLCDAVIAPSQGVRRELAGAGVTQPMHVIPTGLDEERFGSGDGAAIRKRFDIPEDAYLIGHVGRLAPEKNLGFLMPVLLDALERLPEAHLLIVGKGDMDEELRAMAAASPHADRVCFAGVSTGQDLVDAYYAMDVFAFASYSETQGMVLAEAMTAGTPVVALEARGVEDILEDGVNGRMISGEDSEAFTEALVWMHERRSDDWSERCRKSAEPFGMQSCTTRVLALYEDLIASRAGEPAPRDEGSLQRLLSAATAQYDIGANAINAVISALSTPVDAWEEHYRHGD